MSGSAKGLLERVARGDAGALARAITLVDSGWELRLANAAQLVDRLGQSLVLGITGPPGVGKSTLINALIAAFRDKGRRVAVLAVDPSSPISGGAVLGDRTRMGDHTDDPGVFIRSVSSRGHLGGLSASINQIINLVDVAAWEVILLETVGAGQSETEIAEIADIKLVVCAPGLGDEIQAIKAGILEIADILVVNKADSPLAGRLVKQLEMMLSLRESCHQDVAIVQTVATERGGLADLLQAIHAVSVDNSHQARTEKRLKRARRQVALQAGELVKERLLSEDSATYIDQLQRVANGTQTAEDLAAATLINFLGNCSEAEIYGGAEQEV